MSVTFTRGSAAAVSVTPVPGSVRYGDGHDDRGGRNVPNARGGVARNGQCQVVIDDTNESNIMGLVSGAGEGDVAVAGTDIATAQQSHDALIDVEVEGDAVQLATIAWKGTIAAS